MKNKVVTILKVVFIIVIVIWIGIVLIDYFQVRGTNDPMFCLKQEVRIYDKSGENYTTKTLEEFNKFTDNEKDNLSYTKACVGAGYKVYQYHRLFTDQSKNFSAVEFGPFFITERQSAN